MHVALIYNLYILTQFEDKDLYLLFITSYFSTPGVFLNLRMLNVHQLKDESMPLLDSVKQFSTLTALDLSTCALSRDMQEDFQVSSLFIAVLSKSYKAL